MNPLLLHHFYDILDSAPDGAEATLSLRPEHPIFEGHFPGLPVVPGVCMVQMTKELLERSLGRPTQLATARNIKFLSVLNPEENKTVRFGLRVLSETPEQLGVEAKLSSPDGSVVFFKIKAHFNLR
ncbi:MAG: hydroxymyristoyl-ACP dehydratase [Saprospiraceae bacterium]|nr:hydroxymyristoyl-ACP dehydratase [Saprospiraceae bacterium]